MCSYVFRHGMTQCVFLLPLLWIYFLLLKRCFPHMHKFKILMWKGASVSQDVTFANGLFSYRHSIVTAGPIPMETKCHWKSNITQSGAMAQMRSGSDISDFLFHFCSPPPPPPPKTPQVIFSPIQYLKRNQSCLYRWQLPWGTVTASGPLFQFETGSVLGHLERWK